MGLNFDKAKAYAPQEDTFYDDGREIELLHFVYSHPKLDHIRGSPSGVLAAIDEYGRTKKYLMNVGQDKGGIVSDLIQDVKPKTMVRRIPMRPSQIVGFKAFSEELLLSNTGRVGRLRWLLVHPFR